MVERRRLQMPPQPAGRPGRKRFVYQQRREEEEPVVPFVRFVPQYGRSISRRALIRALAEEFEFGNSISRLYIPLLVRAVLEQQPQLLRKPNNLKYPHTARDITRCGIKLKEREREGAGYVVC